MLTELYIEALLVDEELADLVWELWDRGVIDGGVGGDSLDAARCFICNILRSILRD